MITRITVSMIVAGGSLAVLASPARAADGCYRVNGTLSAELAPDECHAKEGLCTHGSFSGQLRGSFDFETTKLLPASDPTIPTVFFFTGRTELASFRFGNLTATEAGTMDQDPFGTGKYSSLLIITGTSDGGHASGSLQIHGTVDFNTYEFTGTYVGEVCSMDRDGNGHGNGRSNNGRGPSPIRHVN